jgi:hypothetical protein
MNSSRLYFSAVHVFNVMLRFSWGNRATESIVVDLDMICKTCVSSCEVLAFHFRSTGPVRLHFCSWMSVLPRCSQKINTRIRVLLEKLIFSQLVKEFSTLCGTRRFITMVTVNRHLYLSTPSSLSLHPSPFYCLEKVFIYEIFGCQ